MNTYFSRQGIELDDWAKQLPERSRKALEETKEKAPQGRPSRRGKKTT